MIINKVVYEISDCLGDCNTVLLAVHESPDGDAIGSMLGLGATLKLMGKKIVMFSPDRVPQRLRFLPYVDEIVYEPSLFYSEGFDVFIMLDCGDRGRAGKLLESYSSYKSLINIDHHASNDNFGNLNFIDLESSCTGEEVYLIVRELFNRMNIEKLNENIATCLLTALYDDTGGMRYISTTSRTLLVAAGLVDSGANCSYVSENLFFSVSRQKMELTGKVLSTMKFLEDGKISYLIMKLSDLDATGAISEDSEGLIDFPRAIEGVEVAFLLKEVDNNKFKLSFRSREKVDVNEFCSRFGGGGHRVAAGCTIEGELEEVLGNVLGQLKQLV